MSPRMLRHICILITSARPLWGLLTLNEYNLPNADPLSQAIHRKAELAMNQEKYARIWALCISISSGTKFAQLSHEEKQRVREVECTTHVSKHKFKLRQLSIKNRPATELKKRRSARRKYKV